MGCTASSHEPSLLSGPAMTDKQPETFRESWPRIDALSGAPCVPCDRPGQFLSRLRSERDHPSVVLRVSVDESPPHGAVGSSAPGRTRRGACGTTAPCRPSGPPSGRPSLRPSPTPARWERSPFHGWRGREHHGGVRHRRIRCSTPSPSSTRGSSPIYESPDQRRLVAANFTGFQAPHAPEQGAATANRLFTPARRRRQPWWPRRLVLPSPSLRALGPGPWVHSPPAAQTNAPSPVTARPVMSVLISLVPSYE